MKRYRVDCYSDQIEESVDGKWVLYSDHVEAMKRIAGDSAQEPDAWIQADHLAQAKRGAFMCRVEAEYRKGMDLVPIFAAPSASAQQAEPEKVSRRVHLSAAQLLEALEFVAPDRDTDQDQLDGEVTIEHGEGHSGTGYYCYVSDYPEEGAILLDGESASSIIAAPAPASPAEYIKQLEKETSFAKTTLEATREAASGRNKGASPAALTDEPGLLEYVLQDDLHNRTTPRVIDIAYTAFMAAKQPNTEDGGPSDWFTDTRPVVLAAIEKLRKDLLAASPADQGEKKQ